ncbi:response regulator transcription factor [Priestia megaterium]|uniref:response regulator transcription factor n=1 Tax=Priestia megaterium TaxID=1404 RepID=UPI000BF50F37|nr:response regulator [Priestia megaterium]MCM3150684.1 response regulator [Priestia megaterium]MDC7771620.1 response regulator [Priestia megaterium]MED3980074.1 response regulator [Priestia megaterium]PEU72598.1 response regulator [Priestia megaterium]PFQ85369.1 response regulator [Priestia megaterium]
MAKILLAEDEEVLRMLVVDTLEDEGHDVTEAENGEEALKFIKERDFDLIILDYMMPVFTGLEVIQQLQEMKDKRHTKVLMLSAKNQAADQSRVLEAGAAYFMSKPFSPLLLAERVEEILDEQ